jgi:hypothetical protein
VFAATKLSILGHLIPAASAAPLWVNVQVIFDFPTPSDCKALQRLLGMIKLLPPFPPGGRLRKLCHSGPPAAVRPPLAAIGFLQQKNVQNRGKLLHLRQGAPRHCLSCKTLPLPPHGQTFQLWTNHKPLIFVLNRVVATDVRLHMAFISEYTSNPHPMLWQMPFPAWTPGSPWWLCAAQPSPTGPPLT